ncbi:MAG TPA: hypothetical protein VNN07_04000, partial [Candidatus Tectomicrobia bacterium]|nr:hypothetical protein [Candidatus Tectomicrobia bacterium]
MRLLEGPGTAAAGGVVPAHEMSRAPAVPVARTSIRDGALVAVVILALALNGIGLGWGLPPANARAWEIDGITPLEPLATAKAIFVDDWWNSGYYRKYPLGHYFVLLAAYAPYLAYLKVTGGL